jgi:hypothetical protein
VKRPCAAGLLITALAALVQADAPDRDVERSAWQFRRAVALPAPAAGTAPSFAALTLPPEVATRCQAELQDARLLDAEGRDVPFVVDRTVERAIGTAWVGRLLDVRPEKRVRTVWVADFDEVRSFDLVSLDIRQQDFAKRVTIEVSEDGQGWRTVKQDAGVFDRPWNVRVHHTSIVLGERSAARYVRVTADDQRSRPVELQGITVSAARLVAGEAWRRPVGLRPVAASGGVSRYRLDMPAGFPLEMLELEAQDPAFSRRVVLYESREVNGRKEESPLAAENLYRLRIEDEALSGESLTLPVRRGHGGGEWFLEIHDGDSPPLRNLRAIASATGTRLLFPLAAGPVVLYYGNDATRAPVYDIETLKWRIGLAPSFVSASLGPESANPRYRKTAPLPFAAARGTELDVARWSAARPLTIGGAEDLYTLTLAGEDLGQLRSDLGDLRLVDEAGRQVPYILEPAASEARVVLGVEKEPGGSSGERAVTRYHIAVPASVSGRVRPLPLARLELTFGDAFFSRPARVTVPARRRGHDEVLFQGQLATGGRRPAVAQEATRSGRDPLAIPLREAPLTEMQLEIDEGDNVPLTLSEAVGAVRVPRLAFKAGPGPYRLLLGNPAAAAPRYDIATLRQEILSYSAIPVATGPSAANPAFRRRAGDYFQDGSPTLLLWGTLLAAVAGLLFLTARILRQPATPR